MPKIFLVDDVELFLELEKSLLADLNYELFTASSGEEVLERIGAITPDLLLLDLYMGGIDGDEVCRRLRADDRWSALPIIMVTAAGRREEVERCLLAGCDDYVTKPVSKAELTEKVQRLLGQIKARKSPRETVGLPVYLESDIWSGTVWARDISSTGLFLESPVEMPMAKTVKITLDLPGGQQARILGKVVRGSSGEASGFGVYIVHHEPEGAGAEPTLLARQNAQIDRTAIAESEVEISRLQAQSQRLDAEGDRLRQRVRELEEENLDFANQIVRTEEINNNLTNLYIASSRLHSVLDLAQVTEIIKEITINFVGAEKFALLMRPRNNDKLLEYTMGEGFGDEEFPQTFPITEHEIFRHVVEEQENYFIEGTVDAGSDDPFKPLAAIPLVIHGDVIGVVVIYRLLVQKERFEAIDFHLFSMMAEHAATALFSSSLYEQSERKRETYRGFMDLLLK
jgi:CheY-like chemotaxis protein